VHQGKSGGHMHIPPPGVVGNSGPHFDQALDQPVDRPTHIFPPNIELPDHMQEVVSQNPHLQPGLGQSGHRPAPGGHGGAELEYRVGHGPLLLEHDGRGGGVGAQPHRRTHRLGPGPQEGAPGGLRPLHLTGLTGKGAS